MTKYRNFITILLGALVILGTASCHSARNASSTPSRPLSEWHELQVPVRVSVKSPMSMSLSGRATMVRDSLINISMRVFGFEVAVVNMTADSIFVVDKHNKYYFAEPLSSVMGSHQISVGRIQDLILGRDTESLILAGVAESPDASDKQSNTLLFRNPGSQEPVTVSFNDYVSTDFGSVASDVSISAPVKGMDIDASLTWSVDDAKWNSSPRISFKAPGSGYRRLSIDRVRSIFKP